MVKICGMDKGIHGPHQRAQGLKDAGMDKTILPI